MLLKSSTKTGLCRPREAQTIPCFEEPKPVGNTKREGMMGCVNKQKSAHKKAICELVNLRPKCICRKEKTRKLNSCKLLMDAFSWPNVVNRTCW